MRKLTLHIAALCGLMALSLPACVPPDDAGQEGDQLLVQLHNKSLHLSELDGMIPASATSSDSTLIINAYVNRWVKENLMLHEAERNIPKDLNLDRLVRDYRSSLIIHNYEKLLAESELDSTITEAELIQYYEKYKSHFQVNTSIRECQFAKFPSQTPDLDDIAKLWDSEFDEDKKDLLRYCKEYAEVYQLEPDTWLTDEELEKELPKSIISSMKADKIFDQKTEDFRYFVRVGGVQSKNSEPPVGYIRAQATKYILHNRKMEIVNQRREELYDEATRKGLVEYH